MLRVEFHCHTIFSKDSLTRPQNLVDTCRQKGIDRVIVTDHNTIAGAQAAQKLDPELVVVGEEILTARGEILAAYVTEEVPPFLSPQETLKRLRDQGAFISVSHPFDKYRTGGWDENDLLEIIEDVDAIEVYNSRCMNPNFNRLAVQAIIRHNVEGDKLPTAVPVDLLRGRVKLDVCHAFSQFLRRWWHLKTWQILRHNV